MLAGYASDQLRRMESFSVARLGNMKPNPCDQGLWPPRDSAGGPVPHARALAGMARCAETLTRFRKLHREYFAATWEKAQGHGTKYG